MSILKSDFEKACVKSRSRKCFTMIREYTIYEYFDYVTGYWLYSVYPLRSYKYRDWETDRKSVV